MNDEIKKLWTNYLEEKSKLKEVIKGIKNQEMNYFFDKVLLYEEEFESVEYKFLFNSPERTKKILSFYTKWIKEIFEEISSRGTIIEESIIETYINLYHYIQTAVYDRMKEEKN